MSFAKVLAALVALLLVIAPAFARCVRPGVASPAAVAVARGRRVAGGARARARARIFQGESSTGRFSAPRTPRDPPPRRQFDLTFPLPSAPLPVRTAATSRCAPVDRATRGWRARPGRPVGREQTADLRRGCARPTRRASRSNAFDATPRGDGARPRSSRISPAGAGRRAGPAGRGSARRPMGARDCGRRWCRFASARGHGRQMYRFVTPPRRSSSAALSYCPPALPATRSGTGPRSHRPPVCSRSWSSVAPPTRALPKLVLGRTAHMCSPVPPSCRPSAPTRSPPWAPTPPPST